MSVAVENSVRKFAILLLLCCAVAGGCVTKKPILIPEPGAPAIITNADGRVRIAYWSDDEDRLIDFGWVDARMFKGWTFTQFDWEDYAAEPE